MHPPYTDEKKRAAELAAQGESVLGISCELSKEFPELSLYVRDTLARQAHLHHAERTDDPADRPRHVAMRDDGSLMEGT